jgi:alkanesulfonate monooxygenase SsuD/methylene tetrahydromethanopterin reductase-like flavin-dependent oxidoreductase (luciferase family)
VSGNVTAEPQEERGPLIGSPEQVAADLDQTAKLGVEHV